MSQIEVPVTALGLKQSKGQAAVDSVEPNALTRQVGVTTMGLSLIHI